MTFDALTFLDVAVGMVGGTEAEIRTAIGRAYYAMFLRTRDSLAAQGLKTLRNSGEDHGSVVRTLRQKRRVTAGEQLEKLMSMRRVADYDTSATVSLSDLDLALSLAQDVRRMLTPDWGLTT